MSAPRRRPIAIVLGMHRSGTSLLSNIMHYIGCDMADGTDTVSPKNPGGFWERPAIVAIHDEILAAIGRSLSDPRHVLPFPAGWWRRKDVQALKTRLIDFVRGQLAATDALWGFKDPRTCRLLPLWNEIFRALNLDPVFVYALRSPEPSARSMTLQLLKPRPVSVELSELMWLAYNFDTVRHTTAHAMLVIDYDDWFVDPERIMCDLADYLPLDVRLSRHELAEIANELVTPGYRNESETAEGQRRRTIARGFYEKVRQSLDLRTDGAVRGQLPFIELMFRTVAPVVERLTDINAMEAQLVELDQRRAQVLELKADRARLTAMVERFEADDAPARLKITKAGLDDADRRLAKRKAEAAEAETTIAALRAELAAAQAECDILRKTPHSVAVDGNTAALRRIAIDRLRVLDLKAALATASAQTHPPATAGVAPSSPRAPRGTDLDRLLLSNASGTLAGRARFVEAGIEGMVTGIDGPPLIVAALVDGQAVANVLTASGGDDAIDAPVEPGAFLIPWHAFPLHSRGRALTLQILGTAVEIETPGFVPDLSKARLHPEGGAGDPVTDWLLRHHSLSDADREAADHHYRARIAQWPLISVLLLDAGRGPDAVLRSAGSLLEQVYDHWELVIPASATLPGISDPRIRVAEATDMASLANAAEGSFAAFLSAGDRLAPDALLATMTALLDAGSIVDMVYTDEDRFDSVIGGRSDPHLKGAWSLDLVLTQDYPMRLALLPLATLRAHAVGEPDDQGAYASVLRAFAGRSDAHILHLPHILYHRDRAVAATGGAYQDARRTTLANILPEVAIEGTADRPRAKWPLPSPLPRVSLIVPTRDRLDLLAPCIEGLLERTFYPDLEILIVDNQSREPATLAWFERIARDPRVTIVDWDAPFDYSAINNFGVQQASGAIIGLVNNDISIIEPHWLMDMVRHVVRPDVGIVGARLLYADGTLQHAGVVLGIGTASHLYKGLPADHGGQNQTAHVVRDVSAVTAACLLIRRDVWDAVGGLSTEFPVAYNDIDLCLAVRSAGYRILYEPHATLHHLESQTRGLDADDGKKARLAADRERLIAKWGDALSNDPFYSPNLALNATDGRLADPPRTGLSWLTPPRSPRFGA